MDVALGPEIYSDDFAATCSLAGYFVAHGMWSVSDGCVVLPMIAHEGPGGRGFQRFFGDDLIAGARQASEWLDENPDAATRAVLVLDGYADIDGQRHDALIARAVEYGPPRRSLHIVVPYRPKHQGFAVHSPRFGGAEGLSEVDLDALGKAFFHGVVSHAAASPIWTAALDESV